MLARPPSGWHAHHHNSLKEDAAFATHQNPGSASVARFGLNQEPPQSQAGMVAALFSSSPLVGVHSSESSSEGGRGLPPLSTAISLSSPWAAYGWLPFLRSVPSHHKPSPAASRAHEPAPVGEEGRRAFPRTLPPLPGAASPPPDPEPSPCLLPNAHTTPRREQRRQCRALEREWPITVAAVGTGGCGGEQHLG